MHVCHIGFNYFPGQGLTIFYEFARHQAQQGLKITVIAPGRPNEPDFEIVDGIHINRIPLKSIGRFSLDRLRFLIEAARILRKNAFDLVHTYAFVGAGLLPLLGRRAGTHWLYDCQTSAIKPPLLGLQNWLIRLESCSFDTRTVLSEGIRDIVFGPNWPVAAIVPLGADLDRFSPQPPDAALRSRHGIAEADCVLTYCGTLDRNRKMEKLLTAFAFAAKQEPNAKLLVIGDGSALPGLKAQAIDLALADRIIFTGFVPYRDIPSYLTITTIALAFISMDACFEHQPPTKTVEYLAQGLPVIATDTAGNRTFITDDDNGLLCGDSKESCSQAIVDLIRDPPRRQRLAARARDSVKSFDWNEVVRSRVIPLYQAVLREHRLTRYE